MKIACTSDWHIHEFQDFSKQILVKWDERRQRYLPSTIGKEMNSRLFHILDGICDLRDYCVAHKIYHILHAGDVFHKRGSITVNTFNAAHRILQTFGLYGLEIIIIAGNHDQVDASTQPDTSIHTFAKSFGIMVVEEPLIHSFFQSNEQISILCIPYGRNKTQVLNTLQQLKSNLDTRQSILLMHCGITGGAVGSGMHLMTDDYSMDELSCDKWKYVVLGHYHRPQLLAQNTFYCGTPVQNSFNDELPDNEHGGYNGFFVVDTEKQFDINFIPIHQPRFITVSAIEDVSNYPQENYFRVKTTDIDVATEGTENVRVEVTKQYDVETRSSITLTDTYEEAVRKYHQENYTGDYGGNLELGMSLLSKAKSELS